MWYAALEESLRVLQLLIVTMWWNLLSEPLFFGLLFPGVTHVLRYMFLHVIACCVAIQPQGDTQGLYLLPICLPGHCVQSSLLCDTVYYSITYKDHAIFCTLHCVRGVCIHVKRVGREGVFANGWSLYTQCLE